MIQQKKVITFGEIMLRLSAPGFLRFSQANSFNANYGGGEANVAVSVANYDFPVEFVTRLPENDLAEACLAQLRANNVGTQYILRGGDRMGLYFMETGAAQRPSKVIYDRSNSSFAMLEPGMIDWNSVFDSAAWFHWTGITPAVSQSAANSLREALGIAQEKGVTISVDLNYRKNLWKWGKKASEVMPDLVQYCDVVIGNEEDTEKTFGIQAPGTNITGGQLNPEAYQPVCEELAKRNPRLKQIAITLRESVSASHNIWSAVLWEQDNFIIGQKYDILPMVDRVGGGDSFAGGLIFGLLNYPEKDRALRFAIAASCLKHSIWGDFNQAKVSEIENLLQDTSGRINR